MEEGVREGSWEPVVQLQTSQPKQCLMLTYLTERRAARGVHLTALSQTHALPTPSSRDKEGRLQKSCALDWRDRTALGSPARPHRC